MPDHRPVFRSDIEGLRGVAILLVVLFHAGVSGLSGGFVGVDVFFVLSGYFITGPLVRELTSSGRIDLVDFYWRRALRLLPVLLVVLVCTLAIVSWLYAPIDRAAVASTATAVAGSAGNIEFARTSVNYFSSSENPLLHTWSLGVEQQFYLVWPLLLLLFAFIAARASVVEDVEGSTSRRYAVARGLLIGIALTGVISFAASVWITRTSQSWAFFGLPTRMWEFALGGVMAMLAGERETTPQGRRLATAGVLQAIGLVAIAIAVEGYDRIVPYPGVAALLPALGAMLLVAAGSRGAETQIGRLLRTNWLQWLGRLSYAWYLWHWPLMGLGGVLTPGIGAVGKLAWGAVALVLAWLTYRFVEKPARDGKLLGVSTEWLPTAA
ncbi:MAG: acyltransferase, partial [Gemmatimonas sp.]